MPENNLAGSMSVSSRKVILGSITASIAFVLELTLVPLLLPAIQTQFDLSISELSWLFNSYGAAVAVGVLMGGWLGDTFNTKRVFGVGVMFFAFGSAVVAYGGVYEAIIAGRIMQGFGGGVNGARVVRVDVLERNLQEAEPPHAQQQQQRAHQQRHRRLQG